MTDLSADPLDRIIFERLRFLQDGETDYLGELIQTYFDTAPKLIESLRDAIADSDTPVVQKAAHTLKGSSASLGASVLSSHCRELEMLARSQTLEGAPGYLASINSEYERVERALRNELSSKTDG
jgi:HPt (histidine-containing phosphotransfer) domain-containing protein